MIPCRKGQASIRRDMDSRLSTKCHIRIMTPNTPQAAGQRLGVNSNVTNSLKKFARISRGIRTKRTESVRPCDFLETVPAGCARYPT